MRWLWWEWAPLLSLGILVIVLFCYLLFSKMNYNLDISLLGLLSLGVLLIALAVLQPENIKYGDLELKRMKNEANEAIKASLEASAMTLWNSGRWGGNIEEGKQTEIVDGILENLYGGKATQYKNYLLKKGLYLAPEEELKKIPDDVQLPRELHSPLLENYLKEPKNKFAPK